MSKPATPKPNKETIAEATSAKDRELAVPVDFARAVGAIMIEAEARSNPEATPLPSGRRVRFVLT
jgi:hypothetical protein